MKNVTIAAMRELRIYIVGGNFKQNNAYNKNKMNKYDLIDSFFIDQEDYIKFLVGLKERTIANDDATCFATLEKIDGCFLYKLTWLKDGKYIGDYVKPFRASIENLETFNNGCKILAQRLEVYIDTNDVNKVPNDFPAFKNLTEYK